MNRINKSATKSLNDIAPLTIHQSSVHGKGVFANQNFKKGDIVISWKSYPLLTREEMNNLPPTQKQYISHFKSDQYILYGIPAKYVNHSCNANTKPQNNADVAVRAIKKGEEITADYTREGFCGKPFLCSCGSSKCKKIVKNKK